MYLYNARFTRKINRRKNRRMYYRIVLGMFHIAGTTHGNAGIPQILLVELKEKKKKGYYDLCLKQ